jgi:hypothetical protein
MHIKSLTTLQLTGLPPVPRGVPQIPRHARPESKMGQTAICPTVS